MAGLQTFQLPDSVDGTPLDLQLAQELVRAWRTDGILQVATDPAQSRRTHAALESSRRFFSQPAAVKASCISDLTFSGYIASGEERTAGEPDYSEIFTVCPDVPLDDPRVRAQWPCHGPVPWPDDEYERAMTAFMAGLGVIGEKLLRLAALGLGLDLDTLTSLTRDGWHHLRVLRFPARSARTSRGIGAHTDYGLLVIAAQDDVGGLYIRPPVDGERRTRNWLPTESMAGRYEDDEPWTFVEPVPGVVTVFPGDMLQLITDGLLLSTPHKVRLNTRARYALAYFHEPRFQARIRSVSGENDGDSLHYGSHFTRMFMRSYPERVTTRRILAEDRLSRLVR
ncbi:2-oxoglutarate and iron-dependent oxygenase domain-containing protein [Pseudofrankia inefficax]|uniref:2OG-Fe(II) oxygenase n=1 Tax=Pseudofrankia inefficax (strain DSM 45817 / CECT 9037 / DDB 130130 / EuI1c) TaxID=298654 RepID=E3J3X6_PSEI1|nr:2-oxoglutarate and iron-dependent oxygenase domain-containing protein [Pseudofrankia inefficax]ADP80609.1 2OG-Fe(II) oxygenase [Pseudofrankia inefficax]